MSFLDKIRLVDEAIKVKGGTRITAEVSAFKPIEVKCSNDHIFTETFIGLEKGKWCKRCDESKITNIISEFLSNYGINCEKNKIINSIQYSLTVAIDTTKYLCFDIIKVGVDLAAYKTKAVNCVKSGNRYGLFVEYGDTKDIPEMLSNFLQESMSCVTNNAGFLTCKVSGDEILTFNTLLDNTKNLVVTNVDIEKEHPPITISTSKEPETTKTIPIAIDVKDVKQKSESILLTLPRNDIKEEHQVKNSKASKKRKEIPAEVREEIDNSVNKLFVERMSSLSLFNPSINTVKFKAIVGYIRVSTEEQKIEGHSLNAQISAIKAYAAKYGLPIREIYKDEGISGKDMTKRPGIQQCILKIEPLEEVVCANSSRLSRNAEDSLYILRILTEKGASLRCLDIDGDMSKSDTKFYFGLKSVFADFERNQISDRIKSVMKHLSDEDQLRTKPAFGYKVSDKDNKTVINEEEMRVIDFIRDTMKWSPKTTRSELCRQLNAKRIPCRKAKKWYHSAVTAIMLRHGMLEKSKDNKTS